MQDMVLQLSGVCSYNKGASFNFAIIVILAISVTIQFTVCIVYGPKGDGVVI